ncbi:hypothetical protein HU811_17270 [Pseudomonas sp. SWRI196]|uniref:Uncharacterized protein n=1 Tax=Pseudomonas tehranensis TaxID=2745502 RepID=A0ABR6UUY8_9PSED|nr:hypothetical protein [Pseudomonas tehranensis]MBC3348389.1 hypothetical protein [Pseudomonas tehranensis]
MPRLIVKDSEVVKIFAHLMVREENARLYDSLVVAEAVSDISADAQCILAPGYRLLRINHRVRPSSDRFEIALVNDLLKSVVYYNQVVISNIVDLNCRPATQNLVWRSADSRHSAVLRDVAQKVFFNYILNRYDVILSDNQQTGEGKFFWQRQMSNALALGLHVYYYQMLTASLIDVPDQDALDSLSDQLWSESDDQQYHLALISKIALPAGVSLSPVEE